MMNFERYFLHDRRIFLDNISYDAINMGKQPTQMRLKCNDTVLAQLSNSGVKISFNRALTFEPQGIYTLSVTFSVFLIFDPSTKDEIDWQKTDISGEFRKSCPALMSALMSRSSLLIAQITSSAGQLPLVTPPSPTNPAAPYGNAPTAEESGK